MGWNPCALAAAAVVFLREAREVIVLTDAVPLSSTAGLRFAAVALFRASDKRIALDIRRLSPWVAESPAATEASTAGSVIEVLP